MQSDTDKTTDNTVLRWDSAMLKRMSETPMYVARERYEQMLKKARYQSEHRALPDARFIGAA